MTASLHPLDPFLPLLTPEGLTTVTNVAVLSVREIAQLLEIGRDPSIGRYLLGRISDTEALVDPGAEEDLVKALRAAGHTPRIAKGIDP